MCRDSSPVRARSRLESLPVEIIQEIFLHCLDFNLPRSSIHISRVLSNSTLYTWLIRLAFSSPNDSSRHGFFTRDFLPPPLDFWSLSAQQRQHLQTDILGCGWCTLPLIRKCQREYVEHALTHKSQSLDILPEDKHLLATLSNEFNSLESHDKGHSNRRSKGDLILRAQDPTTGAQKTIAVWFHFGAVQTRNPKRLYTHHDLFQLPSCAGDFPPRIPDKLLCPPWSADQLDFLQLLSVDAYIDDDSSAIPRSARVLRQVIRDRDFGTFERLLGMHVRTQNYKYPLRWPVSAGHFAAALKYTGERDDPFIRLLVDQRWEDIPADELQLKNQLMAKAGLNTI